MNETRNLILAVVLSAAVLFGWQYFVAGPQLEKERAAQALVAHAKQEEKKAAPAAAAKVLPAGAGSLSRADALKQTGPRIAIETPSLDGSLLLKGARFDDLRLKNYRETTDPKSPEIVLLSPESTSYPYYTVFGWVSPQGSGVKTPDDSSVWKLQSGTMLTPTTPVTLTWDNGQGLQFTRTISVDKDYLFQVRDTVANYGHARVTLYPYADVVRDGVPTSQHFWALHEGYVGVADGTLKDANYTDFKDTEPPQTYQSTGGWFGFTDKYWMAVAIPPQNVQLDAAFEATPLGAVKAYQANYRLAAQDIAPGASITVAQRLFAGAKIDELLERYENRDGVTKLHLAIDWGWFWFFTQPIFKALDFLSQYMNMGLAILLLTVLIKARFKDDQQKQQQEIMDLYKREKINPIAGCLPMLIQIPVFFSLYKVLLGTIEMRQAPFFGWIHDLSAPDPTSALNLFGLLPFDPHLYLPQFLLFLSIGAWPIFMGFTQWFQMKLNPPSPDPVQQRMFAFMPLIFTFMLAGLPSGLVIYWTWNNFLSTAQQYVMMRRQGVTVDILGNMKLPAALTRLTDVKRLAGDKDNKKTSSDTLPGE
jgi:YidC/Oxa1 family membrane protein insertase